MKKTLYVARNELYSLFYSPIAWVMMVLFVILTSADYIGALDIFHFYYQVKGLSLLEIQNLTYQVIDNPMFGFYPKVIGNLYLFLPLITMGLVSREMSSGSIKLLQSSPIRIRQIVFGKFLSMVALVGVLMSFVALNLIALSFSIIHPDFGQMLASSLGLCLVLLTYAAIGLFVSSLSGYQVVAAILTLAIFAIFGVIGKFWQDSEWIRNITFYLSLPQKSKNLLKGLLNTRDVCYFLLLTGTFLAFTIIKIKSSTESISWVRKAGRYALVIAIVAVIANVTENPWVNSYFDASRGKIFTITPPTQETVKSLNKGPLKITAYADLFDGRYNSLVPNDINDYMEREWEPYIRFKPDITVKFRDYYHFDSTSSVAQTNRKKSLDQILDEQTDAIDMRPSDFVPDTVAAKEADIKGEEYHRFFILEYNGKRQVLRTFFDNIYFPKENEISAALKRMIVPAPKVGFLKDEIERGPFTVQSRDYAGLTAFKGFRESLINQGYDFDTISLRNTTSISDTLAGLVIADPRRPFPSESLDKIYQYIDAGGNMMITTEPDRKETMKPILDKLGLSLRDGLLMQSNKNYNADLVYTFMTDTAQHLSQEMMREVRNQRLTYPNDTAFMVSMSGANAIDYVEKDGFKIYPLLYTHSSTVWNRVSPVSSDSLKLRIDRLPGDQTGTFITALMMTRVVHGKEQRIFVASDADCFASTMPFVREMNIYNSVLGAAWLSRFTYGNWPANTLRPLSIENMVTVTDAGIGTQKNIFYWGIPAVLGLLGSMLLIRRKRK